MTNIRYWQPIQGAGLANLFTKSIWLRQQDAELFKAAGVGREILTVPEIVKSCLFYSLGKFHKSQGDYLTATSDYFYSIFHSIVAVYKVHFDTRIIPSVEFDPTTITVKRKEVNKFADELAKANLLSKDFRRTYESLQKRRDHISYQPRIILEGKEKKAITFFACQYGDLTLYIENVEPRLPSFIFESVEMVGHILHYYYLNDETKDITAILYFKNWAKICLMAYRHWGARITSELEGTKLRWDSVFKYNISDKDRKAIISEPVLRETEEIVRNALEILKSVFSKPNFELR